MGAPDTVDCLVIGGGFYGSSLALFLRSVTESVGLLEANDQLLQRASRVNQARVHTGFHYPRSILTAVRSMALHRRFAQDFPEAVYRDFKMLYAVSLRRSKISAKRFHRMFSEMGAPIQPATSSQAALFSSRTVEAVFACDEFAFDYSILLRSLEKRLAELEIDLQLNTPVTGIEEHPEFVLVRTATGKEIRARTVFNVTYAQINSLLETAGLPLAELKHELTEIALMRPPEELAPYGITVMDGPFFSFMPYPAQQLHSLTHVRYTPHLCWTDASAGRSAYEVMSESQQESQHRHMVLDGLRFVPALAQADWVRSLYEVKTVLVRNERDDGRPILYQQRPAGSRVISIMGGKIDNIYDLFDLVRRTRPEWRDADDRFVHGRQRQEMPG